MIKAVIFDCFGVLTQDGWSVLMQKYATKSNKEEIESLNKRVDRGLMSFDDFAKQVSKLAGISQQELLQILVLSYHPEEEVFELIRKLKKDYRIGLISNISSSVESYLPGAPMDLFEVQTLSYQVGYSKPSPEIFKLHLNQLGVEPEEAVFIDDRQSNIVGAEVVGMKGIWFKNSEQLRSDLTKLGVQTS